jgi:AraC-like DNA-binding protein
MKTLSTPQTHSSLRLPRPSLQSCIYCFMTRDTYTSTAGEFWTLFPSSPFPGVIWTIHGHREIIDKAGEYKYRKMDKSPMFYGVCPHPLRCRETENFSSFNMVLQPDVPHALFGWDASAYLGDVIDANPLLPADWKALSKQISGASDHHDRQMIVEQFLEPRWAQIKANMSTPPSTASDWIHNIASRIAISKPGSSIRQIERRFKAMIGMSQKQLKTLDRGEKTLLLARDIVLDGRKPDWSKLAAELGYYDQAHLCNEVKRMTGYSPQELASLSQKNEDAFWVYRLWQ